MVSGGQKAAAVSKDPFAVPIEVLPGKWLTAMNKVTGNRVDMSTTFRVWGELTTYKGRNYILPTFVATLSLFGGQGQGPTEQVGASGASALGAGQQKNGQGGGVGETEGTGDGARHELPEKLRAMLLAVPRSEPLVWARDLDVRPVRQGAQDQHSGDPIVVAGDNNVGWKDGHMIVGRVGGLIYDAEERCWLFAFGADAESLAEPPVVLHPCRLLEFMEGTLERSLRQEYCVSGQITRYQSRNYMLLRKAQAVYDSGNLGD